MFNLILYMLTINCIFAVPMKLRQSKPDVVGEDLQKQPDIVAENCSWFSVHFSSHVQDIHIPVKCILYTFVDPIVPECDSGSVPMNCTYKLRKLENESLTNVKNLLSLQTDRAALKPKKATIPRPNLGSEESMKKWATTAVAKALIYYDGKCKPGTVGKPPPRTMDCDACWFGIPYPCNCNCRGWNQIGPICNQPCHERGDYSFDSGAYCHIPCNREGSLLPVGCGLGHDRVCLRSSGHCFDRWVRRTIDVITVMANIIPGAAAKIKAATKAVKGFAGLVKSQANRAAAYNAARTALQKTAKEVADKLKTREVFKNAFRYLGPGAMERVLEEATIKFMTANLPLEHSAEDWGWEIAKIADPTGIITVIHDWIPPESCDDGPFCSVENCEVVRETPEMLIEEEEDMCTPYGGVLTKFDQGDWTGWVFDGAETHTCCAKECGDWCGSVSGPSQCGDHPLGHENCCIPQIFLAARACGENGQMAPCIVVEADKCTPYGGTLNKDGVTCCSAKCAPVGWFNDCNDDSPIFDESCQRDIILEDNRLCSSVQNAPCVLKLQEDFCTQYDGKLHPDGNTCCARECGHYCGASNCAAAPQGPSKCCGGDIGEHLVCGRLGTKAPCHLVEDWETTHPITCEWKEVVACGGEWLKSIELDENQCVIACEGDPHCDCVWWRGEKKKKSAIFTTVRLIISMLPTIWDDGKLAQ